jgi:hypothetical protein
MLLRAIIAVLAYAWAELLRRQYHPLAAQYTHYSLRAGRARAVIERFMEGA